MQALAPPDVEGYLNKLGADHRWATWKRRFFFTRDGDFFYTKSHLGRHGEPASSSADSVGVIPLQDGASAIGRQRRARTLGRRKEGS